MTLLVTPKDLRYYLARNLYLRMVADVLLLLKSAVNIEE